MIRKELPTQEYLNSIFEYKDDGKLYWKIKTNNRIRIGSIAGTLNKNGYLLVQINKIMYYAHRLIWKMFYGTDPKEQIDHINHDRIDNRIENLREVSAKSNGKNSSKSKSNTSGHTNIYINSDKYKKKFMVCFRIQKYNKSFLTLEEAIQHRDEKYIEFGFHENHGC